MADLLCCDIWQEAKLWNLADLAGSCCTSRLEKFLTQLLQGRKSKAMFYSVKK